MPEPTPADSPKPLSLLALQPLQQNWIWQANQLAAARYQLGECEQKLLLYCISMIDGSKKESEFRTYRVNIASYAAACGINTTVIYKQLKAAAKTIRDTPLMLLGHVNKDGKKVDLYTSWFVEVECASGHIDVMFAPSLRPYLLGVANEFYKFHLAIPLHLSGEYTIRLYQLCKRWKYAGRSGKIAVRELRMMLGLTVLDGEGAVVKERLPKYGDAKKWAIFPALAEMARASDIVVAMKEYKKPGSKLVESVEFLIHANPEYKPDESLPKLLPASVEAAPVDPAVEAMRETLLSEFRLNAEQTREAFGRYSLAYIEEKAAITRVAKTDNMAAYLVSALRKDFKAAKSNKPAKAIKKAAPTPAPEPVAPPLTPEKIEANRRKFTTLRKSLGGGPSAADAQAELALALAAPAGSAVPAGSSEPDGDAVPF